MSDSLKVNFPYKLFSCEVPEQLNTRQSRRGRWVDVSPLPKMSGLVADSLAWRWCRDGQAG